MTAELTLLDASLLNDSDKLAEISHWLKVMNRPNGWHYDLDHIWILRELEAAGILPGSTILDAGAGEARLRNQCKHLNYVAQDIAEYDGKGDGEGIQTKSRDYSKLDIISNIYDIPLEKNSFDAILCIEVLEHVTDPVIALKELYRILKPGGVILITAPFNSLTHYSPYHFSTGFTKYFYLHHLNDIGFNNIEITTNGNYFEYTAQELRRIKSVAKEYSNKKLNFIYRFVILLLLNLTFYIVV